MSTKWVVGLGLLAVLAVGPMACGDEEGPMEQAGRRLDEAAGEMIEKARGLSDEGRLERVGRELDEAAEETREAVAEAVYAIGEELGK